MAQFAKRQRRISAAWDKRKRVEGGTMRERREVADHLNKAGIHVDKQIVGDAMRKNGSNKARASETRRKTAASTQR